MHMQRRWARTWDQVRFCSDACRKATITADDTALEQAIVALLQSRARSASICPSEASRAVFGAAAGLQHEAMRRTRYAANRLVVRGTIEMTQKGRRVDPSSAKGAIRLVLPR